MNLLKNLFSLTFIAGLLAGCDSTNNEPIYFASAVKLPTAVAVMSPVAPSLSKADEEKIELVVLSNLMERHFWEDGNYSALFLQADDKVVALMMAKFPNHNPPIKESYHIDLRANRSPLDKDTGKPVMILGADVSDPNADGSVDVVGRWYAGGAVQGFYTFNLIKTGDDWTIASVK
jgi:hypothetical protein